MKLSDRISLDGLARTRAGYLKALVRCARTGIQDYRGSEVGKPEMDVVRVYRPEEEVFSKDSLRTFAHLPITVDHPNAGVSAENWAEVAVGQTGQEVLRDGDFVSVPILLMDAAAIKTVENGKRELSMGYEADLEWTSGITADGLQYDAIQRNLRMDHLSVVSAARGGKELKIGDNDPMSTKIVMVDGLQVETTEAGAAAISKLQADAGKIAADLTAANTRIGTLTADLSAKDGEIAALKAQVADAALTPDKLDAAVRARGAVVDAAKKIFPAVVVDGKSDGDIRRQAVAHKLGDAAAAFNDDAVAGAFKALADAAPASPATGGTMRDAFAAKPATVSVEDAQKREADAWSKNVSRLHDAWKTPASAA